MSFSHYLNACNADLKFAVFLFGENKPDDIISCSKEANYKACTL